MRTLSKCKLFLCFRPVVDIDAMLEPNISEKHGTKKSKTKFVFFQKDSTKFSGSWIMKQPPKKTLSSVIKAVVSETMLKRRAHQQKNLYLHDSFGSKHSYGSETTTPQSPLSSSSSSSHGSTSPCSSSPKASSLESKNVSNKCHPSIQKQNKFECNGIYLVLISLLFTVFWGKLFGIVLSSMWLYLFTLLNSSYCYQKRLPRPAKVKDSRCHYYHGRSYF